MKKIARLLREGDDLRVEKDGILWQDTKRLICNNVSEEGFNRVDAIEKRQQEISRELFGKL